MKVGKRKAKKVNQIKKLESHWMKVGKQVERLSAKGQYIGRKQENVKQKGLSAKVNLESYLWSPQFSQKTNVNNSTWGIIVVKLIFGRIEETINSFQDLLTLSS